MTGELKLLSCDRHVRPGYGRSVDARTLLSAVPRVHARGGTLDGELELSGRLRAPELSGRLALHDVGITLAELGQRFDRVGGELRVSGRTLDIERLTLHDREGSAEITGQVELPDLEHVRAELRAVAKNMPVRRSGVRDSPCGATCTFRSRSDGLPWTAAGSAISCASEQLQREPGARPGRQ